MNSDYHSGLTIPRKKILCIGEILWDLLPDGPKEGGAPMNVALHLKKFHFDVKFAGKIGKDTLGADLKKYLECKGLDTDLLQVDDKLPTGTVRVHLGSKGNDVRFEIVDNVAWDNIISTKDLENAASEADVIIYGTLASRHSVTRRTVLDTVLGKSCLKLLDVNLREPYYEKEVVEELLRSATIVKMNTYELKVISGWHGLEYNEKQLAEWICKKFNCKIICITRGEAGAFLFSNGQLYEHPGFKVDVKDTVGSGDAFLAGFIFKYLSGEPLDLSLGFACATGALIATMSGATPDYKMSQILKIMNLHSFSDSEDKKVPARQ